MTSSTTESSATSSDSELEIKSSKKRKKTITKLNDKRKHEKKPNADDTIPHPRNNENRTKEKKISTKHIKSNKNDSKTNIDDAINTTKSKKNKTTTMASGNLKKQKQERDIPVSTVCFNPSEIHCIIESLSQKGFAVIDANKALGESVAATRASIDQCIAKFPEFREEVKDRNPLGGFSVFGTPSSFHNPVVRSLRQKAYAVIAPILDALKPSNQFKKEVVIDRLLLRPAGRTPMPETWHRDTSPNVGDDDIILGGWWNFDDRESLFSCVVGSHKARIENEKIMGYNRVKDSTEKLQYADQKEHVIIPSGYIILFHENIAHEVCPIKKSYHSYRLFLAWRVTKESTPLVHGLEEMLEKQAPVTVKSNQQPHMWTQMHWCSWVEKLAEYSSRFKPVCCSNIQCVTGKNAGKTYFIVDRYMKSLEEYGLPKYPPYSDNEKRIYFPH